VASPIREIQIPENNCTIQVYADGVAIVSPSDSRVRSVWREKQGGSCMHHVLEWEPQNVEQQRCPSEGCFVIGSAPGIKRHVRSAHPGMLT
jgi:hypothetical protein